MTYICSFGSNHLLHQISVALWQLYYYDCIKFGAQALHELSEQGHSLQTVKQAQVTAQLRAQTMHIGVSGLIDLDENCDRVGTFQQVFNYQRLGDGTNDWVTVGFFGDAFEPRSRRS